MTLVLDAGAEDLTADDSSYTITTDPHQFETVHTLVEGRGLKPAAAEVAHLPVTPVPVTEEKTARGVLGLVEALEEHDDVQAVHAGFEIADEIMEKMGG